MIIREAQDGSVEKPCPADVFKAEPILMSGSAFCSCAVYAFC